MALSSSIPFENLSLFQKAIWQVFAPIEEWHTRDVKYEFVFDTANNQYQVYMQGWRGNQRLYGTLIHIAIRNDLVWLEENNTEIEVAEQLMGFGVPKDKIVLSFHPPTHRAVEGFATGET
jgi:hypothetical protein